MVYLKHVFVFGRWNTDEGGKQSFKFFTALIILDALWKEYNVEKKTRNVIPGRKWE